MLDTLVSLTQLAIGQYGIVETIKVKGIARRRLLDLGFVPGSRVEAIRRSPAGDPTAFYIRGAIIAMRNSDASQIMIEPIK